MKTWGEGLTPSSHTHILSPNTPFSPLHPPISPICTLPLHTLPGVTKALRSMNKRLNLPQLQKIMMQFERESEIMDLKEETISDTIDDVIGEGDEDEVSQFS